MGIIGDPYAQRHSQNIVQSNRTGLAPLQANFSLQCCFLMEFPSSWWPVHCARATSVNSKIIRQKSSPHFLPVAADLSKCKRCTQVLSSDKCSWADQSRRLLWGAVFIIWRKSFLCHKTHKGGWLCLLLSEGQWVLLTPLSTQQSLWAPPYLSL